MIKNLVRTIISIPVFMFFLLMSLVAMAQAAPPEIPADGDKKDSGHQHSQKPPYDPARNNSESAIDPKKPSSSAHPSDSGGAKPSGPSSADQKNPASGTGGSKGY
jgi:hypothetical protein